MSLLSAASAVKAQTYDFSVATTQLQDFLKLDWQGGTLELSPDLQTWTPLPWARDPFLERLDPPPFARLFYRIAP